MDGPRAAELGRFLGSVLAGQYRVDAVLGEGGMGVVYRARQLSVDRDVALKVMRRELVNDARAVLRFENEARVVSRLRHPNTIRLFDCQRTPDGDLFLVTELLSGSPLSEVLRAQRRLPVARAVKIADHICRSLAEAHADGIVHRDLKPANVFIERVGVDDLVKVLDFGIAKILEGNVAITRVGSLNGTPAYMSPEQALGKSVDARTDLYSLGVMLFEMITGRLPFSAMSVEEMLRKQIAEPAPTLASALDDPRSTSANLESLVARLLAKAPDARPSSVDAVIEALAALGGRSTSGFGDLVDGGATERSPMPFQPSAPIATDEWGQIETDVGPRVSLGGGEATDAAPAPNVATKPARRGGQAIAIAAVAIVTAALTWSFANLRDEGGGPTTEPLAATPAPTAAPDASSPAIATEVKTATAPVERAEPEARDEVTIPERTVEPRPRATIAPTKTTRPASTKARPAKPALGRDLVPVQID